MSVGKECCTNLLWKAVGEERSRKAFGGSVEKVLGIICEKVLFG